MTDISVERHFPEKLRDKYEFHQWKHAYAILKSDFPNDRLKFAIMTRQENVNTQ